jgi:DNA-binding CsgD family transcriptional regulator
MSLLGAGGEAVNAKTSTLDARLRLVLDRRSKGQSYRRIARKLGISHQRVEQLMKQALRISNPTP